MFDFFVSWYHDTYSWLKHLYEYNDLKIKEDEEDNDDNDDNDDNTIPLFDYAFYQAYIFI